MWIWTRATLSRPDLKPVKAAYTTAARYTGAALSTATWKNGASSASPMARRVTRGPRRFQKNVFTGGCADPLSAILGPGRARANVGELARMFEKSYPGALFRRKE